MHIVRTLSVRTFCVRTLGLALAMAWTLAAASALADTKADPPPDWDNPRKIILQLTDNDPDVARGILSNAANLQKYYGAEMVRIAIVAYKGGVRQFLAGQTGIRDRIESLQMYDTVEFIACGNTMASIHATEADLVPGVQVVTAGIAEIVERKMEGWHYIVP